MTELAKPSGYRALSPAELENERLVQEYMRLKVRPTRRALQKVLKDVRAGFQPALPRTAWQLLDYLVELSHDRDWQDGLIIVWPSNGRLMDFLGCGERSVQLLLRALTNANLITHRDNNDRRRKGFRDAETGRILDAYGIDLRPLAARAEELTKLAESIQKDRIEARRLRSQVGALGARLLEFIRMAKTHAPHPAWEIYANEVETAQKPASGKRIPLEVLRAAKSALTKLESRLRQRLNEALKPCRTDNPTHRQPEKHSPSGAVRFTHKTTTNPPSSSEESVALSRSGVGGSAEIHPESSDQETQAEPMMSWSKAYAHLEKYKITPRLVFEACPSLIELDERGMTADTANWDDLHALANQSRSVMGISPKAWNTLIEVLGPVPATVAMAVLTEKGARSVAGTAPYIANIAGYVWWFARTAQNEGFLDIGPKVWGLIENR